MRQFGSVANAFYCDAEVFMFYQRQMAVNDHTILLVEQHFIRSHLIACGFCQGCACSAFQAHFQDDAMNDSQTMLLVCMARA